MHMEKKSKMFYSKIKDFSISCSRKIDEILWFFGRNAFMIILILVLLELIFAEFLFYKYVFLAKKREPVLTGELTEFRKNEYKRFSERRWSMEKALESRSEEPFADPFAFPENEPLKLNSADRQTK